MKVNDSRKVWYALIKVSIKRSLEKIDSLGKVFYLNY